MTTKEKNPETNNDELQQELWDRSYLANMDTAENYNVQAVS